MKSRITLLVFLFAIVNIQANENRSRMSKDDIMKKKWNFIVEKASLSTTDAQKVQPLFIEYENEIWNMMKKNREIFRRSRRGGNDAKMDFAAINDAYINFEIQKAISQRNYYHKLRKLVDEEVIFKIFNAERTYRQKIIQKAKERPGPPIPRP